ncbi:MAG: nucleotide sugar dehydrogenase [Candidatus Hodarchaeota archaeon]
MISVLGLGYVGLPLAVYFAQSGYTVFGVDIDQNRVEMLKRGKCNISKELETLLANVIRDGKLTISMNGEQAVRASDFIIVVVPTPVDAAMIPVLQPLLIATKTIQKELTPGKFVIIESTTYPGTTEEVIKPILETSGYVAGSDFGLAYSPERIDPGNKTYTLTNIPKIMGGITPECTEIAIELYKSILNTEVISVSDPKTAEATKMLENTFRGVNIALINELSYVFQKLGINTFEVIEKANTKPFSFLPHYPGPGVGGHCIPVDPYYLAYKAKTLGLKTRFIELAGEINQEMPFRVIELLELGLNAISRSIKGSNISILGLAYKKNVNDTRNSPARFIIKEIFEHSGKIKAFDPLVKKLQITEEVVIDSEKTIDDALKDSHAIILVTNHDEFEGLTREELLTRTHKPVVFVDSCNFFPAGTSSKDFVYIGLGKPYNLRMIK